MITSHQNPLVKSTLRLRSSSHRKKQGKFLIDGIREIQLAMGSGYSVETIFCSVSQEQKLSEFTEESLATFQPRLITVSREIMMKLSYGERNDTPLAVAQTPSLPLRDLKFSRESLVLVLDRTEKPGNLGACLRTSTACSVDAVILTQPLCDVFNPNVIRASRGTIFQLPIAISTAEEVRNYFRVFGLATHAARVDGSRNLWQLDFRQGAAVIFGNEADGLGADWADTDAFTISMSDRADSLNLSISAAVTLYEACRQRTLD
ncbi:MAG: TrmH family RNA methyltransferase [Planctomycetota bacterium]|nr:TrmH family RNA methyltransferase [Planctomycetota bacterium]